MGFVFIKWDYCNFTVLGRSKPEVKQPVISMHSHHHQKASIYQTPLGTVLLAEPSDSHYDLAVAGSVPTANSMLLQIRAFLRAGLLHPI